MSDNIKVVVKVRPLISREVEDKLSYRWLVKSNTLCQLDLNGRETDQCFIFDKVYGEDTQTSQVYNDVAKPIVEAAIDGFNGTIFAYGQTSSGKTYTMTGTDDSPGIIQLAVLNLFDIIKQKKDRDFLVRVSFIEIYNETLKDLLNVENKKIKVKDTLQGVKVDCQEKVTGSPEEVLDAMKQGEVNRHTGATNMNEESSRSHSIFQITIESREHVEDDDDSGSVNVSTLNLVDLAGSERAGQTGATGIRFKEGTHINKSLSSLALVIKQLSEDPNKYVNYRDSKLTRILQNSLGGNAKTSIICAITPASVEETISTLQFANRAKSIKNKPEVNAVATNATMIQSLTKQLSKLQSELAAKRNLEVMLQSSKNAEQELQTRIANLQKMILNGFGQRCVQVDGRRKASALRRVTISTLHHIEEEPAPPPRFATPSLKYNPQCLGPSVEPGRLAPVPEEARAATPPLIPLDDVIEINSDDDSNTEAPCSPYHKCYSSSKTPPCILRKQAKQAEKNFKDIVELTDREKMYTPNVVELMEKLEKNAKLVEQLQEVSETLKETSKEKDLKIEQLTDKVRVIELTVETVTSAKSRLEDQCKEQETKLIDLEVSYETLLKKSKTREEELLSLLTENQAANNIGTPKKMETEMLNLPELATVSESDNESSTKDDGSSQLQDLVAKIQIELTDKIKANEKLESEIYEQKLQIESLRNSSQELQITIDELKSKLAMIESENSILKCTIEKFDSSTKCQQLKLESTEKDIESYKNTIQELQIQLYNKEDILNMKVDDAIIENMITNEQKCISNNDNIKNIIQSLKVIIESRNEEIGSLKTIIEENTKMPAENIALAEEIKVRDNQISILVEEMEKLKNHLTENTAIYKKLLKVEQDLTNQLATMQKENKLLIEQNTDNKFKIEDLQKENYLLIEINTDNKTKTEDLQKENQLLIEQNANYKSKAEDLQEENTLLIEQNADNKTKTEELQKENKLLIKQNDDFKSKTEDLQKENTLLIEQNADKKNKIEDLQKVLIENEIEVKKIQNDNESLMHKIDDHAKCELELATKYQEVLNQIEDMSNRICSLEKELSEKNIQNENLISNLATKEISEKDNIMQIDRLLKQIDDMTLQISDLKSDLHEKNNAISACGADHLIKAKNILYKLQDIVHRLEGNTETLPEYIEDLALVLETSDAVVSNLDNSAKQILENFADIEDRLFIITKEKDSQLSITKAEVEKLHNELSNQTELLSKNTLSLIEELKQARVDIDNKDQEIAKLKEILNNYESVINTNNKETSDILNKSNSVLYKLHKIALRLNHGTESLPDTIDDFDSLFETFDCNLKVLDSSVTLILKIAVNMQEKLLEFTNEKESEINNFETQIERMNIDMAVQTFKLSQQIFDLIEQLKKTRAELDSKNRQLSGLENELSDARETNAILRQDLASKDSNAAILHTKIDQLDEMLKEKYAQVQILEEQLSNDVESLQDKYRNVTNALNGAIQNRDMLLAEIMKKAIRVARQCGVDTSEIGENNLEHVYERVVLILDKIGMNIAVIKTETDLERNQVEKMLAAAKEEIEKLTETNFNLLNECSNLRDNNNQHLLEIEESRKLKTELLSVNEIQISTEQHKAKRQSSLANIISSFGSSVSLNSQHNARSPQSLLTICSNKIIDTIRFQDPNVSTTTSSLTSTISNLSTSIQSENAYTQTRDCDCGRLSLELKEANESNLKLVEDLEIATKKNLELIEILNDLSTTNDILVKEREEVKKELKLIVEPAIELQKKITNHRTNLSTLTATTFAENKLLNSQLKVLKHHHTRYINVCRRDLPAFKTQLKELMTLLKESPSHNISFKRFSLPDVLDDGSSASTLKNELILDGDLLMLDTNLTLTTVDNTLIDPDQTCLETTQVNFDFNETVCQTNDVSKLVDPCLLYSHIETLTKNNQKLSDEMKQLIHENINLKLQQVPVTSINTNEESFNRITEISGVDENISTAEKAACQYCLELKRDLKNLEESHNSEITDLHIKIRNLEGEKDSIQEKYSNLSLEIPTTTALVKKLSNIEKEYKERVQQNFKLTNDLTGKTKVIKELQEENDTLSMQVIDNISEADHLKKELDELKYSNTELIERYRQLEQLSKEYETKLNIDNVCSQCSVKDGTIKSLQLEYSKLTKRFSDSESSSRLNKICTLQNELHASKEDCRKITEEVATIKTQLESRNVSVCQAMDLDESMGDSSIFVISKDLDCTEKISQSRQMPDTYAKDKMDCLNFFVEKIGSSKELLESDVKAIDIMKLFYNNLVAKNSNDVENLLNKLKDFEESKLQLQTELSHANTEYSKLTAELSQSSVVTVKNFLDKIKQNVSMINQDMPKGSSLVTLFKESVLNLFDTELGLNCVNIFDSAVETIFDKHQKDLSNIMNKYAELQDQMKFVDTEFNVINEKLIQIKLQLSNKENDFNLLKDQKDKIQEINHALTLDLVRKEQELTNLVACTSDQIAGLNIIEPCEFDMSLSLLEKLNLLFELIITKISGKENLIDEINKVKDDLKKKEDVIIRLQEKITQNEIHLQNQKSSHMEMYEQKVDENKKLLENIITLEEEIKTIRKEITEKENMSMEIDVFQTGRVKVEPEGQANKKHCDSCSELLIKLEKRTLEYDHLRTVNDMIKNEKENLTLELGKAQDIIAMNKAELDHMTSDILVLRESVNDNVNIIQTLKMEAKSFMEQILQLKKQFEDKCTDCSRLESNIKTHEKTAEIQTKMITRLQKQKEEDDKIVKMKDLQLEELTHKFFAMQKECEQLKVDLRTAGEEVHMLKNRKDSLEAKVAEFEMDSLQDGHKRRQSIGKISEVSRRRRQSLHDSVRAFSEDFDENNIEALFEARSKPDDLFDMEQEGSNRSTPTRLSRGRDSLLEDARRRRQSIHDQHRSVQLPSHGSPRPNESPKPDDADQLRERLATVQQELDDLKEKYRELDDECETCAQYLQERDEQCRKLKKEKIALENQVAELKDKIKFNPNRSEIRPSLCHAAVNTDEDWANLHTVVVDRMSFDAEVEKNKKLVRTIEELRCNKQELNNTIAKMQRALEKNATFMHSKELDATKAELSSCKKALSELQQRCAELDEECETCAQYLRERDEQCRRLREAKHTLELKLEELQGETGAAAARRKRQSVHDHNRTHALTTSSDQFHGQQAERDESCLKSSNTQGQELQLVKKTLETVLREKATLESQLVPGAAPTRYVAAGSGIVQNQQLSDVMKENQKLKKMNAKLISICKKRGKMHDPDSNRENKQPTVE